jgi:prepilin-type N-terminal cleavage/methylation domain-containing protein
MKRSRRVGFTIVELMVAVTIIGLLSSIAIPKFKDVRRKATATQIMGDFDVMRHATMSFYVDSGYFPKEAGSGTVPAGLKKYLPNKYSFKKPQWTMDYENWTSKTSKAYKSTGVIIGISFTVPDTGLGRTAMALVGNAPAFTVGSKYTFLISAF